jgi:hypothetical protein
MSDLLFSIIMLTTFCSTFVLNGMYVRWQTEGGQTEGEAAQDKTAEQEKTTQTD